MTAAEAYEQLLVPAIFAPWAEAVLGTHRPLAGGKVLDVACGTGIGARLAARLVGPAGVVVGVDADDGMLAVARKTGSRPGDAPIEWHRANALELPLRDGVFDTLLCFEGLQFLPDRSAGLREMRRVLRPGGALVATVWGRLEDNPAYRALADGLRRFVSEAAARLPPFTLPDATAIRALVQATGFADVTVTTESLPLTVPSADSFVDWIAAGGPTTRHNLAQLAEDQRRAFYDYVRDRLAAYRTRHGLSVPSTRNVVVAR